MQTRIRILSIAIAAAMMPHRAESIAWEASGYVLDVSGSSPVAVGAPVGVSWSYDPTLAVPNGEIDCEGVESYDLQAGAGAIQVVVGSTRLRYALEYAELHDNADCFQNNCSQGPGDAAIFSSKEILPEFAFIWFLDCSYPFNLVDSTSIPQSESDLHLTALTVGAGLCMQPGWAISFMLTDFVIIDSVNSSTWSAVKATYR